MPPPGIVAPPANEPLPLRLPLVATGRVRVRGSLVAGATGLMIVATVAFFLLGSSDTRIGGP